MVESLSELNKICQKPRYREAGNWMVRKFLRDAALPVTWLLLHTPVTANQVTLVSLLIGLMGIGLFACPSPGAFLWGVILLQLWYFLDHVDGQIARYRKTACLTGRFFDFLTHHVIHGALFFALGFYAFGKLGSPRWIVWGALASFSIMIFNLLQDTKTKTFVEKLMAVKTVEVKSPPAVSSFVETKRSGLHRTFSLLHKLCEIHVLMNILTAAAILQFALRLPLDFRLILLVAYGVIMPILAISKSVVWITRHKVDEDFSRHFHVSDRD